MNRSKILRRLGCAAVGAAVTCAAPVARASGFQIQEQSASGLGLAFSGEAAAVHDASTAFWNPAGMSLLQGPQGAVAGSAILPRTRFSNDGTSTFGALGDGGKGGENALVPAVYAVLPLDARWTIGLAVNAPYGLATEWDSTWAGQFHAIRSEIKTINLNPTVSFRLSDAVSLGAGVSYQKLDAELSNRAVLSPPFAANVIGTGTVKGDDWGWGWNLGALFDVGPRTRVGVTYRSAVEYDLRGSLGFDGFPAAVPSRSVGAEVELPPTLSIAVSHRFDTRLRLLADWTWTGWDTIQELRIVDRSNGTTISNTTLNFENTWRLGAGLEYAYSPALLLRGGLAYDKSPVQDAYRTPRLPDEDRVWLAFGLRYVPDPRSAWWLDFGYAHLWVKDASSNLPFAGAPAAEAARGALRGTYETSIDIVAVQVGFRF